MFDLFRSRDKAVRILLGALLVVVGFSMLTYLIPSYNTGASANDVVVAEIGSEAITLPEIQRIVQNTMRGRQMPAEILPTYVPQMVENMINERAIAYEAERLGFEVTDAQIAEAIHLYIPNLFQDGKFAGKEAYAALLAQQNLTIPEFENEMRRQLLITRLRDVALEGTIVTPQEIEQEYKKKNEKIKVEYVKLTADKYKNEVQPTAEEMQRYFDVNKSQYTTPERRNLAVLIADQAKIEQTVNPSDAELQRAYTQNINQFRTPESVKVRHILLKTQGKPPADDAKIKAQADDLLKQVKAGANFADLVKKYSEDPGSVSTGGEYTVQKNGQMVPEFENAAFTLKPGQSEVIKTTYGYHIIQVMQHDDARVKPYDEVKAQLAGEWKKQKVNDVMQQISDKAQTMLQKDPTHPEKVASDLNMQLVRVDGYETGKPVPEIGVSPDFDSSLTSLRKGEVSQPVALQGNKIALAVVLDVTPARQATFAEVQNTVRDAMVASRAASAVQTHAKELLDKAKSMGGDLEKAAKSMGLEVKTSGETARIGAVEGLGSATYIQQGFTLPDGSLFGPVPTPDSTIVAKVIAHVAPDMSKMVGEERTKTRDELKGQKGRDREALFEAGLRETLIKQGKIKVHQDVINRLIASYKGA
jgi:peptidyl-prolyl cis-trans isomerase D